MAHIVKRKTSAGEARYDVRYRTPAGQVRTRTFKRRKDADRHLTTVEADKLEGRFVDPRAGAMTFGEVSALWLGTVAHLKPKTTAGYRSILASHLLPELEGTPVAAVDTTDVKRLAARMLAGGASYQTTKNTLNVLRQVLATAVESRLLGSNPALGVRLPRSASRAAARRRHDAHRYLTGTDIAKLVRELPVPYDLHALTAAYGGLRAGELAGLEVADLDLRRRRLTVRRSVAEIGTGTVVGSPKSGESRTITLPAFLADMLAMHVELRELDVADRLWLSPEGSEFRHSNHYRRTFKPAVVRSGLEPLRFHDLRHTCAALLIAEGAHPKAIQERLGHSSIDITMNTYGHLFESVDEALAEALERVWQQS